MRERRLGPVLVLVLVVLALGGWLLLNSAVFAVRDIRVSGNRILSSAEVTQLSGVAVGDNLFRLSPGGVDQALRRSPWIAGVEVERRWPSTLVVRVEERSPVGWAEDGDGTRLLVAGDGTVLQAAVERPAHLPALGGVGWELAPGAAWGGPEVAVRVAASFPPALRRGVAGVRVGEEGVVLRLRVGGSALYGQPSALDAKNAALLSILRRSGLRIDYVDLRVASAPAVMPASSG